MTNLPKQTIKRIMKEETNLRVSDAAATKLGEILSDEARAITRMAQTITVHCKRKTITAEDIQITVDE